MFFIRLILILCFLSGWCFFQGRVDGIAAIVGKNIVLHSDVLQQAQFVALERRVDPSKSPYLFEKIYFDVRDNMIDQYAILDVAEKDTNLVVLNDEVDRALEQQIDDFISHAGSEKQFLEMAGMSMRQIKVDYWKRVYDMMLVERYQFSKIQSLDVSREEVNEFYNSYQDSIPPRPEQYDYSLIELPFVAGNKSENKTKTFLSSLKENIENDGLSFDSLAQIYSQDPGSAPSGGYLGYTARGSLVKPFEEAAYSLDLGEISNPIKTDFGFHLIRLIARRGEKISTQHILRTINFSEEDVLVAFSLINNILSQTKNSPVVFDSLANLFSKKYNNSSGKYLGRSPLNIPDYILSGFASLEPFNISSPIKTEEGYVLICYYNHQRKIIPDLLNSWDLIYNYTKQNKQTLFFQNWIDNIKNNIYIKIIN